MIHFFVNFEMFFMCLRLTAFDLCGEYDSVCVEKFMSCALDGEPMAYCAAEIGQTTTARCRFYIDGKINLTTGRKDDLGTR